MDSLRETALAARLRHPETGRSHPRVALAGVVDLWTEGRLVDWKTTSNPERTKHTVMVGYQMDVYAYLLRTVLGLPVDEIEVRIIPRPLLKFKAADASPQAYADRCKEWVRDKIENVVWRQSAAKQREMLAYMWETASIKDRRQNFSACHAFNTKCPYYHECTTGSEFLSGLVEKRVHDEFWSAKRIAIQDGLSLEWKRLLTWSSSSMLRDCGRKYAFRYERGLVGQADDSEALSVGKLFHSFMDGGEPQDELEPTMKAWGMAKAAREVFGGG